MSWFDTLPAEVTFVSLAAEPGWSCTTPLVGEGGFVECSIDDLPIGTFVFTLVVEVGPDVSVGTTISNTAEVGSEFQDTNPENNESTATTLVAISADLSVTKIDDPDPVDPGGTLTYTITVTNAGPADAGFVQLEDTLPAEVSFESMSPPAGWSCNPPGGDPVVVTCSTDSGFPPGSAVFTLVVTVELEVVPGELPLQLGAGVLEEHDGSQSRGRAGQSGDRGGGRTRLFDREERFAGPGAAWGGPDLHDHRHERGGQRSRERRRRGRAAARHHVPIAGGASGMDV